MAMSLLRSANSRLALQACALRAIKLGPVIANTRSVLLREAPCLQKPLVRNISLTRPVRAAACADHTPIWKAERLLSAALLGVIPLALFFPNFWLDSLMAIALVAHSHWGLEACVTDYVRPIIFGTTIPKLAHIGLIVLSVLTLAGLLCFNMNDIGISRAIRRFWSIQPPQPPQPFDPCGRDKRSITF
uniref:Succinate dehydrogenase [ubiquinone] cytochrome b small subunit n=1 Tax=Xenopsylla cheopis TaxID=163159 RepID=A0A6M2DI86_XENCH